MIYRQVQIRIHGVTRATLAMNTNAVLAYIAKGFKLILDANNNPVLSK